MPATLTESALEDGLLDESRGGPPPPILPELPPGGGGGDSDKPERGSSRSASITGIIVLMIASTMTFAALVSAMVVRRGLNNDWNTIGLPRILWWNTAALLLSSLAIDAGRRMLRRGKRSEFNLLWSVGTVLGTAFLGGQVIAWRELEQRGFYLAGHPTTAFFYVLTWAHAAHVIGALGAVMYVEYRALRYQLGPSRRTLVDVSALFWHFLDVLWLGIMGLFAFWA
jgi:cytochrome c oxidase subunit 3